MDSQERFESAGRDPHYSWLARFVDGWSRRFVEREHRERYAYASQYVRGKRVLDIACGEGYGAALLQEAGAAAVLAGDKEAFVIERAREKYDHPHITYQQMDAEALALPPRSVDTVVSFETIEHLDQPEAFLKSLRMIAIDGADIFISTPNRRVSNPGTSLEDHPRNPYHVREYTPEEFQALLSQYLEVRELLAQGIYRRTRHVLIAKLLRLAKAALVVVPGGTYWLARVHPLGYMTEPTYVIAHCVNSRRA